MKSERDEIQFLRSHRPIARRVTELEEALRKLVYCDSKGRWHVGIHGDSDVTDVVGHLLTKE